MGMELRVAAEAPPAVRSSVPPWSSLGQTAQKQTVKAQRVFVAAVCGVPNNDDDVSV